MLANMFVLVAGLMAALVAGIPIHTSTGTTNLIQTQQVLGRRYHNHARVEEADDVRQMEIDQELSSTDEDGRRKDGREKATVMNEDEQISHSWKEEEDNTQERQDENEEEEEEEEEERHRHGHHKHKHQRHRHHRHHDEEDDDDEEVRRMEKNRAKREKEQFSPGEAGSGFQYVLNGENEKDREQPEDAKAKFRAKKIKVGIHTQKDFDQMLGHRGNFMLKPEIKKAKKKRGIAGLETADTTAGTRMQDATSMGAIPFEDDE